METNELKKEGGAFNFPYGRKEAAPRNLEDSRAGGVCFQIPIFSSKFSRNNKVFGKILSGIEKYVFCTKSNI